VHDIANLRILVADDNDLIRQFVKRALTDSGYSRIDFAGDGNEAIDALTASIQTGQLYDIVFLDWTMPKLAGIDVLAFIRGKPEYRDAAVVMFTAVSERDNMMKALKMGATSYIIKPISQDDLKRKIAKIIEWLCARRAART